MSARKDNESKHDDTVLSQTEHRHCRSCAGVGHLVHHRQTRGHCVCSEADLGTLTTRIVAHFAFHAYKFFVD